MRVASCNIGGEVGMIETFARITHQIRIIRIQRKSNRRYGTRDATANVVKHLNKVLVL